MARADPFLMSTIATTCTNMIRQAFPDQGIDPLGVFSSMQCGRPRWFSSVTFVLSILKCPTQLYTFY